MSEAVRRHYELYPYPSYPLFASVRRCDTYATNLDALWARFNGTLPPAAPRILIAGCGSFSPYPFALANPNASILALDLSRASLRRARLHCLLHGLFNVEYREGDLNRLDHREGLFQLVDAYGVLHHLEDPAAGLRALAARLAQGGILRLMVYSHHTRREEESVRRALRLLRIDQPEQVRRLIRRAPAGSRLKLFAQASQEISYQSGLADALLHPVVRTYRIDPLLELIEASGLTPLLFAHRGSLADPVQESARIRGLEAAGESPGNFVLYLGNRCRGPAFDGTDCYLLNPCLKGAVSTWRLGTERLPPRLGQENPVLDRDTRRFLRRFLRPVPASELSEAEKARAACYARALFLLRHRGQTTG